MAILKFWLDVFGEMVGERGGLIVLQSLSAIKQGADPSQFPIEWAVFEVSTTTNGHVKISIRYILGKYECVEGGVNILRSFWVLKRGLLLLITSSMSPLRSLCNHPFYICLICPQGINYNSCPEDCGGDRHPQRNKFRTFQLRWTKWLSQNFDSMCLRKWWVWEGV